MKSRLIYVSLVLFLGLLGFIAACANPPVIGTSIAAMTWWDTFIRAFIRDSFLGYVIVMLLAVLGFFLKSRYLRFAILAYALVYLGFVLGVPVSSLGLLSTLTLYVNTIAGIKQYLYLFLIFFVAIIIGFAVGRVFCGWVCPMGAIQQFLFRKGLSIRVNWRVHNWLRWLRYAVLVALIVIVAVWRVTWWGPNDPFRNFFRQDFTPVGLVLMVATLAGSLFVGAPWCRYVCPLGAIWALFSKLSFYKVQVDGDKCTDCGRCWREDCIYQAISPGGDGAKPKVNQLECTSCRECIDKCPANAIGLRVKKQSARP
ncbi:MAG: 4Fe-4S binding protein [Chloroflexota bacterium]